MRVTLRSYPSIECIHEQHGDKLFALRLAIRKWSYLPLDPLRSDCDRSAHTLRLFHVGRSSSHFINATIARQGCSCQRSG